MDTRRWSLSTKAECDFVLEPPRQLGSTHALHRQKPCIGLDKLIQEERDNQEWNVAFQKALVKRLEASERRLTLDDYLDDDDDYGHRGGKRKRGKRREVQTATEKPQAQTVQSTADLPEAQPVFKEQKCVCTKKIRREEVKRKRFVRIMEREQIRFEKRSIRAQRKYERERQKAYKKCQNTQLATEKGYFKRNKDGIVDKAEETFSVFIHMEPGQCGCTKKERRATKCKKGFYKCCCVFYIIGIGVFFIAGYFLTKV